MDSEFILVKKILENLAFYDIEPSDDEFKHLMEILYRNELPCDHLIMQLCVTFVNRCIVVNKAHHICMLFNEYEHGDPDEHIKVPFNIDFLIRCYSCDTMETLRYFMPCTHKYKIFDKLYLENKATSASMMFDVWFGTHEFLHEMGDDCGMIIDRPEYCNYGCGYLMKLHTAASKIQKAFRNAIVDPSTSLCKRRLLREYNNMWDESEPQIEPKKKVGEISDCICTCVGYALNPTAVRDYDTFLKQAWKERKPEEFFCDFITPERIRWQSSIGYDSELVRA